MITFRGIRKYCIDILSLTVACDVPGWVFYRVAIKRDLWFPHPVGIVIGKPVVIGQNVAIYSGVVLGARSRNRNEYPIIKDNAVIYANSVIVGRVIITGIVPAMSFINGHNRRQHA